jgi:hypothetical protein
MDGARPRPARALVAESRKAGERVVVWVPVFRREVGCHFVALLDDLGFRASLRVLGPDYFEQIYDARIRAQIGFVGWASEYLNPSTLIQPNFACTSLAERAAEQRVVLLRSRSLDVHSRRSPLASASLRSTNGPAVSRRALRGVRAAPLRRSTRQPAEWSDTRDYGARCSAKSSRALLLLNRSAVVAGSRPLMSTKLVLLSPSSAAHSFILSTNSSLATKLGYQVERLATYIPVAVAASFFDPTSAM